MKIRAFQPTDVEAVADLHVRSWRTAYRGILDDTYLDGAVVREQGDLWRERFSHPAPNHIGLLAVDDGVAVGFAFALGNHDPRWGTMLDNLHVAPERRGGAVGTRLLFALAELLLADGASTEMHLWVFEGNARTRRYYERLGAAVIERQEAPAPGGGTVAEWRYAWRAVEDLRDAAMASLQRGE